MHSCAVSFFFFFSFYFRLSNPISEYMWIQWCILYTLTTWQDLVCFSLKTFWYVMARKTWVWKIKIKWHHHCFKGDINGALHHYCVTNMWHSVLKKQHLNFVCCALNPWDTSTMVDDPLFVLLELHSVPFWPNQAWPHSSWQEIAKLCVMKTSQVLHYGSLFHGRKEVRAIRHRVVFVQLTETNLSSSPCKLSAVIWE